ncbi:hypothetical protein FACS1894205_0680 [Alphaproteobacteria bacterium]|nr:hypothetical protein FACS1894205_0680 [Alphaproteobacteria bacterium]
MSGDDKALSEIKELRCELHYMRRIAEQSIGRMLQGEMQAVTIRHELEQKRRGFRLMADLAVTLGANPDYEDAFASASQRINASLNMQRTVVLSSNADGSFKTVISRGYSAPEKKAVEARRIEIGGEFLDPSNPVVVTGADPVSRLAPLREALGLPYLISTPVVLQGDAITLLITGRLDEQPPFLPRLEKSDVETVQTVASYLAAILDRHRLTMAENLANYDDLTQLPNQRKSKERLREILILARREKFLSAVMFVDLDGFKAVNDRHGHPAGDAVLRAVAERLTRCVRESDIVGRIGGDEFLVVLSNIGHPDDAGAIAHKIIATLSNPIDTEYARCQIGASIGIALFPDHGGDETTLLEAADNAMYAVKKSGKNAFAFAEPPSEPSPALV